MKRILALFLAVAVIATMNVVAFAANEDTSLDSGVDTNAPITLRGNYPGEPIIRYWSIFLGGTESFLIETDYTVVSFKNYNTAEITLTGRIQMGYRQLSWRPARSLTNEDVGKVVEDTIEITLDNGKTYSFPLLVTYTDDLAITQVGSNFHNFTVGKPAVISMEFVGPDNLDAAPYMSRTKITMENVTSEPLAKEDWVFEIGAPQVDTNNPKQFSFSVRPVKAGVQKIRVSIYGENGSVNIGCSWQVEVVEEGNSFTPNESLTAQPAISDSPANSTETVSAIQEASQVLSSGSGELPKNAVTVTTANGQSLTAISVKMFSGSASINCDTANILGAGKVALSANIDNGKMQVIIPGGFGQVTEPGRIYYPLDFTDAPSYADQMKSAVKGENARTETVKAGGNMVLPTTATLTLKTKLKDTVNVYYFNEDTGRFTKLATVTPVDGKITFATKQLGHMVLTTGTI